MTDILGVPVSVGDKVAYTTGERGNATLEIGTIETIVNDRAYIRTASKRITTNSRATYGIMSLSSAIAVHPELFI